MALRIILICSSHVSLRWSQTSRMVAEANQLRQTVVTQTPLKWKVGLEIDKGLSKIIDFKANNKKPRTRSCYS